MLFLCPAAFEHLVTCSCVLLRVAACCSCASLRVVACRCLLLLRVPACCCVSLPVAPARSCVLLGVIAQSLKPVKLLIQRLPPFLFFFFFFVHDCWSGVFLRVAETIADSLLCLRCGYCSASFQSFVLRLLYYHMGNFCKLIGLEQ